MTHAEARQVYYAAEALAWFIAAIKHMHQTDRLHAKDAIYCLAHCNESADLALEETP
jgi:hypothetical protein